MYISPLTRRDRPSMLFATKKLQNINCIEDPTPYSGGLFLGDIISVIKPEILKSNQIQGIVSCSSDSKPQISMEGLTVQLIKARDSLDYPIYQHFEETYQFIEQMLLQGKNVLVHCHAGLSRSATIVCAYLMRKKRLRLYQALQFIKRRRERIRPNQHFIRILQQYEQQLFVKERVSFFERTNEKENYRRLSLHKDERMYMSPRPTLMEKMNSQTVQGNFFQHAMRQRKIDNTTIG